MMMIFIHSYKWKYWSTLLLHLWQLTNPTTWQVRPLLPFLPSSPSPPPYLCGISRTGQVVKTKSTVPQYVHLQLYSHLAQGPQIQWSYIRNFTPLSIQVKRSIAASHYNINDNAFCNGWRRKWVNRCWMQIGTITLHNKTNHWHIYI